MNCYDNKIAYLISLLMQLKAFAPQKINDMLEVQMTEDFLDKPEISDRNWETERPENQALFLYYLNVNISICERALNMLKEKTAN